MNKWLMAAALVLCLMVTGVACAESYYYLELPTAGITTTKNVSIVPSENDAIPGISPTTGEPWNGAYHPILVNIDSHPGALPQWGISSADIIYEMPLQSDGSTRMAALFMTDIPSFAGPVRSGRVPMGSLREMWGGAWVFYGWQNWFKSNEDLVVDVDDWATHLHPDARQKGRWVFPFVEGTENNYGDLFHRENDGAHKAPYNVQVDMKAVEGLFTSEPAMHPYLFTETGLDHGIDVKTITISHKTTNPEYVASYTYNEMTGLYDRYANGTPYYDALTGMTCSYANVIVLRTNVSWYNNAPQRPVIQYVGEGVAEIFQNGKYIRGKWVRSHANTADDFQSLTSRMAFYDDQGNELELKVGKTFIQVVNNDMPVVVSASEMIEGAKTQATPEPTPTPRPTRTPKPTRTPRANAATPEPIEVEEEGDISFGG